MEELEEMYKEYAQKVTKYLLCLTHDKEKTEDLVQETFCLAIKEIDKFTIEYKMEEWLYQIARNLWKKELRKKQIMGSIELLKMQGEQDQELENILEREVWYQAIESLDELEREIIYLKIITDLTFREIATVINETEIKVRTMYYRAKQKIAGRQDI